MSKLGTTFPTGGKRDGAIVVMGLSVLRSRSTRIIVIAFSVRHWTKVVLCRTKKGWDFREPARKRGRWVHMEEEDLTPLTLEFPPEPEPSIEELTDEEFVEMLLEWAPVVGVA